MGRAAVRVLPDTSQFGKSLGAYIQRIERSLKVEIPTTIDTTGLRADLARVQAEVKAAKPTIKVDVDVDRPALVGLASVSRSFRSASSEGSTLTTVMGQIRTSAASVGATLLTWGPPIVGAAAGVVALAPAVLALVPAATAAGGAIGALALGVKGLGDAFKYAGDPKKVEEFNAAMKALAPSARASVREVLALKPAFQNVQQATQQALFRGVAPLIEKMKPLLGVLKTAMVGFANVANTALRSFLKFVASAPGMQLIAQAFKASQQATAPFVQSLLPLVQIMLRLTVAAAPALKLMADGFLSVVQRINGFIAAGVKSGSLTRTITGAMQALGRVFGAVGGALAPLISILAKLGPLVIGGLVAAFQGLGAALTYINGKSGQIATIFQGIAAALAPLAAMFQRLLAAAVPVITQVFAWLAANVPGLVGVVRGVGTALQPLVDGFRGLVSAIGPQLAPTFAALRTFVAAVLPSLQEFGAKLIGLVGPAISQIGRLIATDLLPAFQRFLPVITPVVQFLIRTFGGVVIGAVNGAINVIKGVIIVLSGLMDFITGVFTGNWSRAWQGIKTIVVGILNALLGVIQIVWNAGVVGSFAKGFAAIKGLFSSGVAAIRGLFSSGVAVLKGIASGAMNLATSAFKSGLSGALSLFKALPGQILSALGRLDRLLFDAGVKLIGGLVNGIKSMFGAVTGAVGSLAGKIKDFFPGSPVKTGPLTAWNNGGPGKKLVEMLIKGLTGSQSQVASAAASVGDTIQKAVAAYLNEKSSLAKKIAADAERVNAARKRYADVVKLHGLTAANAINSARDAVAKAGAKFAADKSRGASAAVLRKDTAALTQAQGRLQQVIKTQGTRTAIAVSNARAALQKAVAKLAGDKIDLTSLNKQFGALGDPKKVALVLKVTKNYEGALARIAVAREALAERLKDAQSKLADAMKIRDDYAASVRQAVVDFGNLTRAQAEDGKALTSDNVLANLRQKLAAIQLFRQNIRALQSQGLSNDALKQLVDAGVEAGSATATALVQGGQAAVQEVNNLTASIGAAANDLGVSTSQQFFQAGVNQAQALVAGLQAQSAQLESQATAIALAMVNAIKRVFAGASYDYGFKGTVPTTVGGKKAGVQAPPVVVNITNPVPEKASTSVTRIQRNMALLGPAVARPA